MGIKGCDAVNCFHGRSKSTRIGVYDGWSATVLGQHLRYVGVIVAIDLETMGRVFGVHCSVILHCGDLFY